MRFPWANTFLLILIIFQAITGYFGFNAGRPPERWLLWLHGIGAYATVLVLFWKGAIILGVLGRGQRWTARRLAFLLMAGLLLVTLFSGLLWTFYGPKYLFGFSVITIHIFLAILLFALIAWHVVVYRWIIRRSESRDRRAYLISSSIGAAGLIVWIFVARAKRLLDLPGASRRFTGSYEVGSYSPSFPTVSWINDKPRPVAIEDWRLNVTGAIKRPLSLSYHQLLDLVQIERNEVIDCTGGWYSHQSWVGVPLVTILEMASPTDAFRSVTFQSITGYTRRFSIEMVGDILLATHVAGETLSHGHGFPLRVVVPGERGLNWVKWLTIVNVNTTPHFLQSPLPVQ